MEVQFRLVVAKNDERVDGPDGAEVVLTAPAEIVAGEGFDPTVEYMRGRLKATGHTGRILDVLRSGEATESLSRLASTL